VRLTEAVLLGGTTMEAFHAKWRAFVRDADVVCSWGRYAAQLFALSGGFLPEARVDLRHVARVFTRGKVGTLEDFVSKLAVGSWASASTSQRSWDCVPSGRAGVRLGELSQVAAWFRDGAPVDLRESVLRGRPCGLAPGARPHEAETAG
jgi:hypothetical protein